MDKASKYHYDFSDVPGTRNHDVVRGTANGDNFPDDQSFPSGTDGTPPANELNVNAPESLTIIAPLLAIREQVILTGLESLELIHSQHKDDEHVRASATTMARTLLTVEARTGNFAPFIEENCQDLLRALRSLNDRERDVKSVSRVTPPSEKVEEGNREDAPYYYAVVDRSEVDEAVQSAAQRMLDYVSRQLELAPQPEIVWLRDASVELAEIAADERMQELCIS